MKKGLDMRQTLRHKAKLKMLVFWFIKNLTVTIWQAL